MNYVTETHSKLVRRYGARRVMFAAVILGVLLVPLFFMLLGKDAEVTSNETVKNAVTVAPVSTLMGTGATIEAIGTVTAVNEARLVTEAGGRITSVPVTLGQAVRTGAVIATIENASERAAVLQAQGVYEAARAGAATSDVGSASADRAYTEALTQATNEYRGAFATADDVLRNTVDQIFSGPDTSNPGVRIDSNGRAPQLGNERVQIESIFDAWALKTNTDLGSKGAILLGEAESNVTRLSNFVTTLATLLSEDDALENDEELATLRADFAAARSTLNGVLQSLSGARTALIAAKSAQEQAAISATNSDVSLAEAQVKQALGALRLAQASLEKTIVRSPLSGTINSLTVKEGTTVSLGTPAAIVSSTGGFEIVAYVNESDAKLITKGMSVTIEETTTGLVTQIASAIDSATKKIELRIGVPEDARELTNGETVRVTILTEAAATHVTREILLPVIAIKMTPQGPIVFSVGEGSVLIAHAVTLGAVMGENIVIADGITEDLTIVTDARGLRAGEVVTIQ